MPTNRINPPARAPVQPWPQCGVPRMTFRHETQSSLRHLVSTRHYGTPWRVYRLPEGKETVPGPTQVQPGVPHSNGSSSFKLSKGLRRILGRYSKVQRCWGSTLCCSLKSKKKVTCDYEKFKIVFIYIFLIPSELNILDKYIELLYFFSCDFLFQSPSLNFL